MNRDRSEPAVAVSSMFSTDLYSEVLDAAAYVTLSDQPALTSSGTALASHKFAKISVELKFAV